MNDGFFIAELDGRRFDICVIGGLPRYIRAQDGLRVEVDVFDLLGDGMGKVSEAAAFTPENEWHAGRLTSDSP